MESLKILIVEDKVLIAEDLKNHLYKFSQSDICLAHSKDDAIKQLDTFKPDVAILDIEMERETDGLEIGEYINLNYQIPFIYVTAHSNIAMIKEIVKTKPRAYFTKPIKKTDLLVSLYLIASQRLQLKKSCLQIKNGDEVVIIPFDTILYIEGDGNYINIYYGEKKIMSRQSLSSIMEFLEPKLFFRIQRSYIINISKVRRYSKKEVEINGNILPVSRSIAEEFESLMKIQTNT
ncbi:MAG: response regulator transcription factor [Bacteroidetes bacterium]|nr:response regulator transcription factor [Bacteroidota bacterium]